jgi:hypothetical protein
MLRFLAGPVCDVAGHLTPSRVGEQQRPADQRPPYANRMNLFTPSGVTKPGQMKLGAASRPALEPQRVRNTYILRSSIVGPLLEGRRINSDSVRPLFLASCTA